MSHSEFPSGISAVAASQFGGSQSTYADRHPEKVKWDQNFGHPRPSQDQKEEKEEPAEEEPTVAEYKAEPAFEPTYDLSHGAESHPHLGLLLDVKL